MNEFTKFHTKTLQERIEQLSLTHGSPPPSLSQKQANNMIENCIGTLSLPLGVGVGVRIDEQDLIVPISTEEPSVVAALCAAAKLIKTTTTKTVENEIIAQIYLESEDIPSTIKLLEASKREIIEAANKFCTSLVARGGGVVNGYSSTPCQLLIYNIHIKTCEAMGANSASRVAEGISPLVASIGKCNALYKIVSNAIPQTTQAQFAVPLSQLGYKGMSGEAVAQGIVHMSEWAAQDAVRATTHNKGLYILIQAS